jgi:GAF domain-containing protein
MGENETQPVPGRSPSDRAAGSDAATESDLDRSLAAERAARSLAEHADRWVERLRATAAEALTTVSLDAVIRDSLAEVAHNLGTDAAAVLLASDDGSELIARTAVGLAQEVEVGVHIPSGEGFAGKILKNRRPLIVNHAEDFPIYSPTLRDSGLRSLVGVPLIVGGRVVGVMHAGSKEPGRFTEKEKTLLESLAYPIAAAVDRVRLFETERWLRKNAEVTAARLSALQRITSALVSARNVAAVCETVVEQAIAGSAGSAGEPGIWMLRDGRLLRVAGTAEGPAYDELPLDESMPAYAHLQGAGPIFVETREELVSRWPALSSSSTRSFAGFPLVVGEKCLGVMAIGYREDHHFDERERAYLTAVAEQAGLALERAEAAEAEAAEQERRAFLAETSLALTSRYSSPQHLLENLVGLAVPRLADWCSVLIERGGSFERVAIAYNEKAMPGEPEELLERPQLTAHSGAARRVYTTGRPLVIGADGDEQSDAGELGPAAEAIEVSSLMVVPLASHLRPMGVMGVMVFASCGTHPRYREEDLELAQELAERAGRLVEDLSQRERERSLAATLTRALLPAHFPDVDGVELVGRYLPAETGLVGGDWYDAFELSGGLLGLVVGDVGGHGVEAASTMARLRNGLFAFASEGHDPLGIFERLSALLGADSAEWNLPEPIASLFFAVLDLATLELKATCAGHPPWILLRDGRAEVQECGGRVLAGGLASQPFESRRALRSDDLCLFMTDGLIERPERDLTESLETLRAAVEEHAAEPLERFADLVIDVTTPPGGRRDDCCLIVLKIAG